MISVRNFLILLFAILYLLGCDGTADNAPQKTRYDNIHSYMLDQVERQKISPDRVFDSPAMGYDPRYYPSEAAISFWSAWKVFGESVFRVAAERQCDHARSLMSPDGLFIPKPFGLVSRLSQARLIIGFVVAYEASGDIKYLAWADDALEGFLKLPIEPVEYKGQVFQLFNYAYEPTAPYRPQSTIRMNPNQESAIGLAFTMAYFAEHSRFFHSQQLSTLAWQNLDASLVLQDSQGRIPSDEDQLEAFDTLYGGYTLINLAWANKYWNSEKLSVAVNNGAKWLSKYSDGTTDRYYPSRYKGKLNDPIELWQRLPVLQEAGLVSQQFLDSLDNIWTRWPTFNTFPGGWICPTTILIDSLHVPKALVLGATPSAQAARSAIVTTQQANHVINYAE